MKKILVLFLSLVLVFALAACGAADNSSEIESDANVNSLSIPQGVDDGVIDFSEF